jgi:hypothetical protein
VHPFPNPLDHRDLQELLTPVLRDQLTLLMPLLLPECHGIPLPGSALPGTDPTSSKYMSALLPQQIYLMAAGGVFVLQD